MLITPAYAQGGAASEQFGFLIPLILMFVIMYFLIIRPQQKRVKEHKEMVANVRRGDTVVTGGGIVGKAVKVEDDEIQVEIAPEVRVKVLRNTLTDVQAKGQPVKEDQGKSQNKSQSQSKKK
jgi:preprotein translocase subunit YajC